MQRTLNNRASVTLALGLEAALKSASMTKLDLAAKAKCSPGHITDIEKRNKNPSQALISQLASALGRIPADLYELGEQKLDEQTLEQAEQTRQRVARLRNAEPSWTFPATQDWCAEPSWMFPAAQARRAGRS